MAESNAFSWKQFARDLYSRSMDADIFSHAAQVAFYFSFALFPLLYFLISLFGIVLESSTGLRGELLGYLRQIMPYSVYELVRKTIEEIVETSSGGKLTLGLVVTLWSASAGVDGLRVALNAIYGLKERRSWPRTKLHSLLLTFLITTIAGITLAFVFYGWQLFQTGLGLLGLEVTSPLLLVAVQWISILLLMLLACELMYHLLPDFRRSSRRLITVGSLVAIGLWIVLTTGFRTYLGYFNTYSRTYGSLGAVMIMMLWLYLTALALMVGGAINAELHARRTADASDDANTD